MKENTQNATTNMNTCTYIRHIRNIYYVCEAVPVAATAVAAAAAAAKASSSGTQVKYSYGANIMSEYE